MLAGVRFAGLRNRGHCSTLGRSSCHHPEGFGSLTVGGDLGLYCNNLATLPSSFGSLQVGRKVFLVGNPVAASAPHFDGLRLVLEDDY